MSKKISNQDEINQIKNERSASEFFKAVTEGNLTAIKIYIDLKLIDVATIKDEYEATPRIVAINASQPEVVKFLDDLLGRPNMGDGINITTLFGAEATHDDMAG